MIILAIFIFDLIGLARAWECVLINQGPVMTDYSGACVEGEHNDGTGELGIIYDEENLCNGFDDQEIMFCEDGTIRNYRSGMCVVPVQDTAKMYFQGCPLWHDGSVKDIGKFDFRNHWTRDDIMGVEQTWFSIHARKWPNWVWTRVGKNIGLREFENSYSQYFKMRNLGAIKGYGRLVFKKDESLVLSWKQSPPPASNYWKTAGQGHLMPAKRNDMSQVWTHYENGDLINTKYRLCAQFPGFREDDAGIGYMSIFECRLPNIAWWDPEKKDKIWRWRGMKWDLTWVNKGEWFPIGNKVREGKDERCAAPLPQEAPWNGRRLESNLCQWVDAQYFKWDDDLGWSAPQGSWDLVGCNESGGFVYDIKVATTYSETVTEEMSVEVGMSISADFEWGGVSVDTSIKNAVSNSWSSTWSEEKVAHMPCEWYDDLTEFKGGCMWQLNMVTANAGKDLTWEPVQVRCTRDNTAPKCPPFWICSDAQCTKCVPRYGGAQKNAPRGMDAPTKTDEDKFKVLLQPMPKKETGHENMHQKTRGDFRNPVKCSDLSKDKAACDARADCKSQLKKGAIKKCKPMKCGKIKSAKACRESNKACTPVVHHTFVKCSKAKRQ